MFKHMWKLMRRKGKPIGTAISELFIKVFSDANICERPTFKSSVFISRNFGGGNVGKSVRSNSIHAATQSASFRPHELHAPATRVLSPPRPRVPNPHAHYKHLCYPIISNSVG